MDPRQHDMGSHVAPVISLTPVSPDGFGASKMLYLFEDFALDSDRRELQSSTIASTAAFKPKNNACTTPILRNRFSAPTLMLARGMSQASR